MSKSNLTHCKDCNAEIANSAKISSSCGAKIKKVPVALNIIALIVVVAVIASCGIKEPKLVDKSSNGTENSVSTSETDENTKSEFYVGETAQLNGVNATLLEINESTGSMFNKPSDGNVFVIAQFEIENVSNNEINVSSILSFEAYCDDYACNFSLGALLEKGNMNQLDGTVAPGKKLNGIIGYEVPADWATLEVHFTPNVYSGKDIVFIANKQ